MLADAFNQIVVLQQLLVDFQDFLEAKERVEDIILYADLKQLIEVDIIIKLQVLFKRTRII